MPRKVYPQKLAEELAERISIKTGEAHEARQTNSGWSVYGQSEPMEEQLVLRPEADPASGAKDPAIAALEKSDITKDMDYLHKEIIKKLGAGSPFPYSNVEMVSGLLMYNEPSWIHDASEFAYKEPEPQPKYTPNVGGVTQKAPAYLAFQQAHGSGKPNSKKGKKMQKDTKKTIEFKPGKSKPILFGPTLKGLPSHWTASVPVTMYGLVEKIVSALVAHTALGASYIGGFYLNGQSNIIMSIQKEGQYYNYEFLPEWVQKVSIPHIHNTLYPNLKKDKLVS